MQIIDQLDLQQLKDFFIMKVSENLVLWITTGFLLTFSAYLEKFGVAAKRPFSLTDLTISNPFIEFEKYNNTKLFLACGILPICIATIFIFSDKKNGKFHRFYKMISCFLFALGLSVFITTFLKVRFAKLRPDFLARCKPILKDNEISRTLLYTEEICSAPFGEFTLNDGYKSCPSGHSTVSICCMLFFSLWLYYGYGKNNKTKVMKILSFTPMLLAFDIATSRIYDFKHGYFDILSGSLIGALGAIVSVYHLGINHEEQEGEYFEDTILPL
jgi:diacylglycerol diphosphate phosphatase/phosphatidate phosphatase